MRTPSTIGLAVLACLAVTAFAADAEWPQFRGPNRDGVSPQKGLLKSWPEEGPKVLWKTELGSGYSGISVVNGRIYTMFGKGGDEFVVCLNAANGEQVWRFRSDAKYKSMFGDGPRSTPTVHDGIVYALSARSRLYALNAADGTEKWNKDLKAEYGVKLLKWGTATSPQVEGDLVLVNVGGSDGSSVVAFHRKTGKEAWRSQDDKAGYSTPVSVTVGEVRQVLFFTGQALVSLAPSDGALLWRIPWKTSYDNNISTPVFIEPDRVFISSGYDVGAAVYRIAGSDAQQIWRNREMKNKFQSSLYHDGHLYGFDEKTFKCIDAGTGQTRWRERGLGHGSLIYADGHLIALGDEGTLVLVEATADGYREKARFQVLDGKTWTAPTLVDGKLYLRNEKLLLSLAVAG